ncbi:MAG TPA: hypothetical protein VMY05_01345 [Acidobacteriota bacterium]|nr:hypothetical protein [Acidobacteriota bacterium]
MLHRSICLCLFWLVLIGTGTAQERAVVFDFAGIGIDAQTIQAATHIFRNELAATGKFSVIQKGEMEAALAEEGITDFTCHEVACAADYGYKTGAENAIIGSLTKLGQKITAEVKLVSVVRKEVVFDDRFSAGSLDDLEVTLRKLAEAVAQRRQIESEATRFAVTEQEAREPMRRKAYITSGGAFGFGIPFGDSYSNVGNLFSFAWIIRYEAGKYVVDNSFGWSFGTAEPDTTVWGIAIDKRTIQMLTWDMGLRYVFNREADFSPFVGGGVGMHFIMEENIEGTTYPSGSDPYVKSDQAMALHLAGGVYAFQSYDFRFSLELKYSIAFTDAFKESGSNSQQIGMMMAITRKIERKEKAGCGGGGGGCAGGGCW